MLQQCMYFNVSNVMLCSVDLLNFKRFPLLCFKLNILPWVAWGFWLCYVIRLILYNLVSPGVLWAVDRRVRNTEQLLVVIEICALVFCVQLAVWVAWLDLFYCTLLLLVSVTVWNFLEFCIVAFDFSFLFFLFFCVCVIIKLDDPSSTLCRIFNSSGNIYIYIH